MSPSSGRSLAFGHRNSGNAPPSLGSPASGSTRLLDDIAHLKQRFKIHITDGFATSGHAPNGEHPIGLGLDIVPGPGGSWNDIDRLAAWAEPSQKKPRPPFRWVGYNGDKNHGRGHDLHLSWQWGGERGPPASWVLVMDLARE